MFSKLVAKLLGIGCILVLLIGSAPSAFGQVGTGGMVGVVTDMSGAVIPGAKVAITDTDTAAVRQITTDNQGRFSASSLAIGNYQIAVTKDGFAPQTQKGLVLAIGQNLAVDLKMQVGTVAQEVTVATQLQAQVNTTESNTGTLVEAAQMQQLPLNGRNYSQLVALAPGVAAVASPTTGANFGSAQRYSIAGARVDAGMILLDGVNIRGFWGNEAGLEITGTSLGVASIAEFQVITNSADAQYSNVSVISEVTRSGTNRIHGSAYGYFRNSAMDARSFFDPQSGPPAFHRNQFGAAIGGPIKKDKTFFFGNYEGIRDSLALTDTEVVPDHNAHMGIINGVTYPISAAVVPYLAIYPDYGATGGPALPTGYTDNPVTGTAKFSTTGTLPQAENYYAVKLDHNITANNTLSGRVVVDRGTQSDPWFGGSTSGSPGVIAFAGAEQDNEANLYTTIQDRHIFSANLINVATFAFVRTSQVLITNNAAVPAPLLLFNTGHVAGSIAIGNVASIPAPAYEPLQQNQNSFTEQDLVELIHGGHSISIGGGVARIECNCIQNAGGGGAWTFPSLTAFLQNQPSLYTGQFATAPGLTGYAAGIRYGRQTNFSIFVQDNWKVTRRITLNLGLRDDYITNPTEAANNFYDITHLDPFTCSANAACDNGVTEAGVSTGFTHVPNMFRNNPSTRNIDPRVGLAWDIFGNGKLAFHGAYGIYHDLIYPHFYTVGSGFNYPNGTTQLVTANFNANNTFPTVAPAAIIPQSRTKPAYDLKNTAYMQEWNATLEGQIFWGLKASIGYVGSEGTHLYNQQQYNTILPVPGTQFRPLNPNPTNPTAAMTALLASCQPGCTNGFGQGGAGYLPNTNFTSVQWFNGDENSNYHSGIVTLQRSLGKGIQFFSGFTWSRCLDYGSVTTAGPELGSDSTMYLYPSINKKFNYGPCAFNISKNWTSNALIPLPFHGNQFKEGWQLGVIGTVHTGQPVTANLNGATDQSNVLYYTNAQERASVNPNYSGNFYPKTKVTNVAYGSQHVNWFDPNAYQPGAIGMLGNAPRGGITGPSFANLDLSFVKNTRLTKFLGEAGSLEIRGDIFNSLNHSNFGLPNSTMFNGTTGATIPNAPAGQITTILGTARQLQFSATVNF